MRRTGLGRKGDDGLPSMEAVSSVMILFVKCGIEVFAKPGE